MPPCLDFDAAVSQRLGCLDGDGCGVSLALHVCLLLLGRRGEDCLADFLSLRRLRSAVPALGVLELSRLYEAFTAARLLGLFSIQEETDAPLATALSRAASGWAQQQSWKAATARERERGRRAFPPYEQVFRHLKIEIKTQVPTPLYTIPFLLPKLSLVFNPVETFPVLRVSRQGFLFRGKVQSAATRQLQGRRAPFTICNFRASGRLQASGFHAPDVSVQHRVWGALGYNCLSVPHAEFEQFFVNGDGKASVDAEDREGDGTASGASISASEEGQSSSSPEPNFDVPAAALFLKKKLDLCKPALSSLKMQMMKGAETRAESGALPTSP